MIARLSSARRAALRRFGIGAAIGGLVATGQAPLGWVGVALAGLVGAFFYVAVARDARDGAWRGWSLGFGYFVGALFWIVEPFFVDPLRHGWMAPFALVLLPGGLALFWAAAGALAPRGVLALIAGLSVAELARGYVLTGFPWALVGYLWVDQPQAQLAAWVGPFGLTLLTFLAAGLPALLGPKRALVSGVTAVVLVSLGGLLGSTRLGEPDAEPRTQEITVRLLQPNAPQHLKWHPDHVLTYLNRQLQFTAEAPPEVDLIVWPETALPYLLNFADDILKELSLTANGRPVIAGITRRVDDGSARNAAVVLSADGTVSQVYDKHHLVPFGEYLPFSSLLRRVGLSGLAEAAGGYSAGAGPKLLDLGPLGQVLPLICYEAIFPQDVAAAPTRPDWILQITNDAWFGALAGPQQHLAQARMRAIEQGVPVLRAANTGVSAAIDARGHVVAQLPLDTHGALDVRVPPPLPSTLYARFGDMPIAIISALFLGIGFVWGRKKAVDPHRPPN